MSPSKSGEMIFVRFQTDTALPKIRADHLCTNKLNEPLSERPGSRPCALMRPELSASRRARSVSSCQRRASVNFAPMPRHERGREQLLRVHVSAKRVAQKERPTSAQIEAQHNTAGNETGVSRHGRKFTEMWRQPNTKKPFEKFSHRGPPSDVGAGLLSSSSEPPGTPSRTALAIPKSCRTARLRCLGGTAGCGNSRCPSLKSESRAHPPWLREALQRACRTQFATPQRKGDAQKVRNHFVVAVDNFALTVERHLNTVERFNVTVAKNLMPRGHQFRKDGASGENDAGRDQFSHLERRTSNARRDPTTALLSVPKLRKLSMPGS